MDVGDFRQKDSAIQLHRKVRTNRGVSVRHRCCRRYALTWAHLCLASLAEQMEAWWVVLNPTAGGGGDGVLARVWGYLGHRRAYHTHTQLTVTVLPLRKVTSVAQWPEVDHQQLSEPTYNLTRVFWAWPFIYTVRKMKNEMKNWR